MKRRSRPPSPNTLQPGYYIFWQQRTYRVIALDPDNALLLHVEPIPDAPRTMLSLIDLLATPRAGESVPLFAPTLQALHEQLEEQYGMTSKVTPYDLPDNYVIKARMVITVVETVRRLIAEDVRRAALRGEKVLRVHAIRRALETVNQTTIEVQVKGQSEVRRLQVCCATYYNYVNLYETYQGNESAIAASFRRATFRIPQMSKAQHHFIDMCLLLYYGNTRVTKTRVYRLAKDILEKRTQGYWIDPERCGETIPQDLVTELLDLKIPFQALLSNPEKKELLAKIEMPSTGWFSGYTRYVEAQPDQGERLITERLGKGIWEQYHLVFDTFVHHAQFPLQYVFADHWLLDAWIVDDETREKTSRLWLTLLIDAYSRSILGMALLYEAPCIESIQQALKHAIWEKTSHQVLGIEKEWNCYGIPMQLFLDNAWAHHSHSLENLARVISRNGIYNAIDLVFRPPYKGRYGAIIERLFKNFSGQVKELVKGAIASSEPKVVRAAAKEACFLYADMNSLLHRLIVKYQHTPHRELQNLTPHQKWNEGIQSSGIPLVPPLTPAMDRLFLRMEEHSRTVKSRGIAAFGLNYWGAELSGIERVDRTGRAIQYHFRYDPIDISRISVFRDGEWIGDGYARELQQADGSYQHLSLAEWKAAKRLERAPDDENKGNTPEELVLVTDLKALGESRSQEKKAAGRTRPKRPQTTEESPKEQEQPISERPLDEETERVLRFLHGGN
jgi:hypothetical protein